VRSARRSRAGGVQRRSPTTSPRAPSLRVVRERGGSAKWSRSPGRCHRESRRRASRRNRPRKRAERGPLHVRLPQSVDSPVGRQPVVRPGPRDGPQSLTPRARAVRRRELALVPTLGTGAGRLWHRWRCRR